MSRIHNVDESDDNMENSVYEQLPIKAGKKKKLVVKFFVIFFSIVFGFLLLAGAVWYGFTPTGDNEHSPVVGFFKKIVGNDDGSLINLNILPPVKTNVLVLGVDDEASLTDTMFVVAFDRETLKTDLISLPRDSWITLDSDIFSKLRIQSAGNSMKLNSIYNKAEKNQGGETLKKQAERILGINIHYWVSVDTEAFRKIVDTIGGVEMDVRPQGYYYYDPTQNLRINVPGGHQLLNGEMAEGVVRFRNDYADGDLGRVKVQQEFLKQFAKQLLSKDTLKENALSFLGILMSYVRTDFDVLDLPKYIAYIPQISTDNITFHVLPGEGTTIYPGGVKTSVYMIDEIATKELAENIFYAPLAPAEDNDKNSGSANTAIDKKNTKIQVLNGASVAGLAGEISDKLEADGYNVANIGNYTGTAKTETRIVVKKRGMADELKGYFKDAIEQVEATLPDGYDIVIIIGTGEK